MKNKQIYAKLDTDPTDKALEFLEELKIIEDRYASVLEGDESLNIGAVKTPEAPRWSEPPLSTKHF